MPDTLDDWLERWPTRKGPATEAEVQGLVDEIERLRAENGVLAQRGDVFADMYLHVGLDGQPPETLRRLVAKVFADSEAYWGEEDFIDRIQRGVVGLLMDPKRAPDSDTAAEEWGRVTPPTKAMLEWGAANISPGSETECSWHGTMGQCVEPPAGRWALVDPPPYFGENVGPKIRWWCAIHGAELERVGWHKLTSPETPPSSPESAPEGEGAPGVPRGPCAACGHSYEAHAFPIDGESCTWVRTPPGPACGCPGFEVLES